MSTSNKILKPVFVVILSTLLIPTIFTYYSALSQYATDDQEMTLYRIKVFLNDYRSASPADESNLSRIAVGKLGELLEKLLSAKYGRNEHLYGNIHNTAILPYAFVQVSLSLLLLFYCIYIIGRLLDLRIREDILFYLLISIIFLNYPTLKGDVKVLKYDALSFLCSLISLLNYILFTKNNRAPSDIPLIADMVSPNFFASP